eukprot:TRINITY_DN72637_c0_g1_i1.p1 TRINITY_DN72637_c0_g1~~TRINITY_DN72637_c0_g1_i1.p1  ORF type:complete len:430 (-),score=55.39 TRINITY_DN72637_c0_g1_i1:73-1314(-)
MLTRKFPHKNVGIIVLFLALFASAEESSSEGEEEEVQMPEVPSEQDLQEIGQRVAHAKEMLQEMLDWKHDDHIEIYNAEFLLASWVLDRAPWNAYHSGLALKNSRTGKQMLYDYTPDDTRSVMKMVLPEVIIGPKWRAAVGDQVYFRWNDRAHMEFYAEWPEHFTNFTRIGNCTGDAVFKLADWVANNYTRRFPAFNPIEVIIPPPRQQTADGSSAKADVVLRSRMCHDFVTDALWVLYEHGAKFRAERGVFRDHIIMYASSVTEFDGLEDSWQGRRKELRYLRTLLMFMTQIREQFTYAREALIVAWRLQLPVLAHDDKGGYHLVTLVPPFLDYCYLPIALPPAVYDPLGRKLCALGPKANLTNSTTPYPWGQLLAAEERMDQPPALAALLFTAVCAAFAAGGASHFLGKDA